MPRRDAFLQIDIAEQRSARLVRPAHHHPYHCRAEGESCSQRTVETGLFQQPVKSSGRSDRKIIFGMPRPRAAVAPDPRAD
jgi:hypothetical protein